MAMSPLLKFERISGIQSIESLVQLSICEHIGVHFVLSEIFPNATLNCQGYSVGILQRSKLHTLTLAKEFQEIYFNSLVNHK